MVSPSKKKRPDRKGKETNEYAPSKNSHGTKKINKSIKPLTDKKFYLDIKNNVSLKKLEEKLKSLGASLELFLVKDVDYVVTDRPDYPRPKSVNPSPSPSYNPSPFCSVSPATTDSPTDGVTTKRTRSRAEAMLERLKQQPQRDHSSGDVLDNAASWRIPIYPLSRFIQWLEKLTRRAEKSSSQLTGVKELKGSYVKIETLARPEFRLFNSWPTLNFDPDGGGFGPRATRSNARTHAQRMTRKVGKAVKDGTTGGGAGYCEVCRAHYGQLEEHLTSATHIKFVTDPAQYSQLDSIIAQHSLGGGSRKSLRIAKSPPPSVTDMGGKQSSETPVLNGHVTRSSKHSQLSPPAPPPPPPSQSQYQAHCNGVGNQRVVTRSKGSSGGSGPDNVEESTMGQSPPTNQNDLGHNLRSRRSTPAKRSRVSRKRLSAEEKLIEDNKAYYRVEVLNSKLRSTGYMISSQRQLECSRLNSDSTGANAHVNGDKSVESKVEEKEPVVVRFKKVRKTQLAVLSDEAESFMFGEPNRRDSSSDLSQDESKKEDADSVASEESVIGIGGGKGSGGGGCLVGGGSGSMSGSKRKRRTHAEAFIHDNLDYYKFEIPGSRLRYQSPQVFLEKFPAAYLSELKQQIKQEEPEEIDVENLTANHLKYSFESVAKNDPWMETYKRQDEGNELYVQRYYTYPTVRLPYEMPTERGKSESGRKSYTKKRERLSKIIDDKPRKSPRCHASTLAIMSSLMRRRPRDCTDRSRSEGQVPSSMLVFSYEEDTRSSIPDTLESSSNSEMKCLPEFDTKVLECKVNEMILSACLQPSGDKYSEALGKITSNEKLPSKKIEVELNGSPCLDVDPSLLDELPEVVFSQHEPPGLNMDIISLLDTYHQCTGMDKGDFLNDQLYYRPFDAFRSINFDGSCNSSDCSDVFGFAEDGRVVSGRRRKRKKRNLTGWPLGKPKKKLFLSSRKDIKCESEEMDRKMDLNTLGRQNWFGVDCNSSVKQEVIDEACGQSESLLRTEVVVNQPQPVKRKVGRPPKRHLIDATPSASIASPVISGASATPISAVSPCLSSPPKKRRLISQSRYR